MHPYVHIEVHSPDLSVIAMGKSSSAGGEREGWQFSDVEVALSCN